MKLIVTFVVDIDPERAAEGSDMEDICLGVAEAAEYAKMQLDSELRFDHVGEVLDYGYLVLEE